MDTPTRRNVLMAGALGVGAAASGAAATSVAATAGTAVALTVPARKIPIPKHLSAIAQAALRQQAAQSPQPPPALPALTDKEGWRRYVATLDAGLLQRFKPMLRPFKGRSETLSTGQAPIYVAIPEGARDAVAYLDIHGGALVVGGGEMCKLWGQDKAMSLGARVYSIDYRMPPDHPYPAGLDDCVAAYTHLLKSYKPDRIVVGGGSAGGNLAAALVLRARDEGLPLPAGVVLQTPELDLTESGDTFETLLGVDTLGRLGPQNALYAGGADLAHPYVSPLFGDFTKGFAPTFISVGTRDMFLSNGARMQAALRRAGVPVDVMLLEAAPHGGFAGSPENEEVDREIRRFVHAAWDKASSR